MGGAHSGHNRAHGPGQLARQQYRDYRGARVSETVLVVDGETPLGRGLVRLFRQSGYRVATTCRKPEKADAGEEGSDVVRAPWGRASPVSARNVLLKTLTSFERLDAAVFTFAPSLKRVLLHETEFVDIESAVDEWVRGTLFLLREVLGQLVRQGSGTLALVQSFTRGDSSEYPPLEAMIRGAISELSTSLLASYGGEGVSVFRFETSSPKTEEYVRFVVESLTGVAGRPSRQRTFRFRESSGFFDRFSLTGRRGKSARRASAPRRDGE
jgi:NAD(P)-dependent dehydrogenase (short-subunit alcohol dehydrogenase family)